MARRQKKSGGGANWMDTYGDMVTLLLCFFVLLYSMSTVSEEKWMIIVKSLNPQAFAETSQIVTKEGDDGIDEPPAGTHDPGDADSFDALYSMLQEFIEENQYQQDIELSKGDGYTFINFRDNVFFDGDSYQLKPEGEKVLDIMADALAAADDSIQEVRILGHTSQAQPDQPNEPVSDRFLASNRATEVLVYLQLKNIIDPTKLVACSYGQFRPISSFDTREDRAKNRRVEVLITKIDSQEKSLDEYYKEIMIE